MHFQQADGMVGKPRVGSWVRGWLGAAPEESSVSRLGTLPGQGGDGTLSVVLSNMEFPHLLV